MRRARMTRRRSSACCARSSRPASCSAPAAARATLIAASPELLVRREGQRVSTLALAASSRRSADPAVDAHLGEQLLRDPSYREEHAIVARRIERTLRPHSVWVAAAPEPELARIANIQHLATPIRAQLAAPIDALELAGLMHPTPAVGGEPLAAAAPLIPALEGLDRGWYPGPSAGPTRPATASSAWRCAARCSAAASLAATRAAGSSATRCPRRSWPRPRSSSRRCCRCSRAEPRPRPHPRRARCSSTLALALGADLDDRRAASPASARSSALAEAAQVLRALVLEPVERGGAPRNRGRSGWRRGRS